MCESLEKERWREGGRESVQEIEREREYKTERKRGRVGEKRGGRESHSSAATTATPKQIRPHQRNKLLLGRDHR